MKLPLIIFFSLCCSQAFSQAKICANQLDSTTVISIAKSKNAYRSTNWQYVPVIQFDSKNCEWIVQSSESKQSRKGKCKQTNGCTEIHSVRLVIDATNGSVKSKTKGKKIYYNYE